MTSPLSFLGPAIDLIRTNASVLPACGGAFEDMARPDVEEADDRFFGDKKEARDGFQDFAETPAPDWCSLYRQTPPVFRTQKHVFRVIDVALPDPLSDRRQDPRDKSGAKARWEMHMLEKRLIEEFAPRRASEEWTIIDGGVRKGEFVELPRTVGVAKSFDRTPTFTVRKGNKGTIRKDISSVLAGLDYGCRTAAFFAHGGRVASWYVRLTTCAHY
jgi:hypothetical protein